MPALKNDAIAVVGMACRFPGGAHNPEAFWDLLSQGRDAVVEVPPTRWNLDTYYDPDPALKGKMYVREGGFLRESPFEFDAGFFRINPHEAVRLDPQQRLILEVAWEGLEDAGLTMERLARSRTGVYVGVFCLDNKLIHFSEQNHASLNTHTAAAATMAIVANRVSYTFNLCGPSVAMDTACSSSLVAFHLACQSLRTGECDHVLVGGVNVMLKPEYTISMCKGKYLAPDGRCKAFDASGDGYGRGEGAGMIVLKRLEDARRDKDRIYAVVRATGANQDGATPGISVPSFESQVSLLREVYGRAGVEPATVGYIEAHGTGTAVGDPIEARALGTVLSEGRTAGHPCLIGSVKTNIAHLEAAAGVAGTMKAILSVYHGQVPPSLHFRNPNPNIDFEGLQLRVPTGLTPWPTNGGAPRRAGVNSFGYGGTNGHILLESTAEEAWEAVPVAGPEGPLCFPISGRAVEAVRQLAGRYAEALEGGLSGARLADISHTLCLRRSAHERRAALTAASREELLERLKALRAGNVEVSSAAGAPDAGPCFVYTGMGPQWWGMGKELYAEGGVFRRTVDELGEFFAGFSDLDLVAELRRDEQSSRATQTRYAQPLNFAVQVGLTRLLAECGIRPGCIVGHSVGEVSAAAVSGALSLEDAAKVSFHRGRLQSSVAGSGGMLAVGLSEAEARAFTYGLEQGVSVAAINGPSAVTLSGDEALLESLAAVLGEGGVFTRKLRVEVPYHSVRMDPLREELFEVLAGVNPREPEIPLYSTVTGKLVEGAMHGAAYWWSNVRESVRFADAAAQMLLAGQRRFLEVGPHPVLASSIRECAQAQGVQVQTAATLTREKPEARAVAEALGRLWELGYAVEWQARLPEESRFVRLPTYPWQRERHWEESEATRRQRYGYQGHPLLGHPVVGPKPIREVELNGQYFPWLRDHRVDGTPVFPGVGYAEIGFALAEAAADQPTSVEELEFIRPLVVGEGDPPKAQTHYDARTGEFEVHSAASGSEEGWSLCARGTVRRLPVGPWSGEGDLEAIRRRCPEQRGVDELYARLSGTGLDYGEHFRGMLEVWSGEDEVLARVRVSEGDRHAGFYRAHPTLLDTGLQALAAAADRHELLTGGRRFLPARIARVVSYRRVDGELFAHCKLTKVTAAGFFGDVMFLDGGGNPVVAMSGVQCALLATRAPRAAAWKDLLLEERWETEEAGAAETDRGEIGPVLVCGPAAAAEPVAEALRIAGAGAVSLAEPNGAWSRPRPDRFTFRPGDELTPLFEALPEVENVVWLTGAGDGLAVDEAALAETTAFLGLLRTLAAQGGEAPRVLLVTRGVHRLGAEDGSPDLAAAPLWGLARVARLEQASLALRSVDLEAGGGPGEIVEELRRAGDAEDEVAWRNGARRPRRIVRTDATLARAPWPALLAERERSAYVLKNETPGNLDGLRLRRIERRAPGADEVEVEVKSAPINFKDVMKGLGMLSSRVLTPTHFGEELGMECAGIVVRTGAGIHDLKVGDRVGLSYQGSFRSHVTTGTTYVVRLPDHMKLEDGCGLITPMLAAWYALVERGRLRKGERILIHSATGGAGLSAIQVAQWAGAEIYATAGTPERREFLRSLGIRYVSDSRSLAFAEDIMRWTGGEGIDVVLNTLAGEGLFKGLKLLRPYGRFIEFGKRDIDLNTPLGLAPFNENLDFIAVDFDRLRAERPEECARIMREVWKGLDEGYLKPLPSRSYPISRAAEAFKLIARSQHLGKVVLSFDDAAAVVHPPLPPGAPPELRGTWLIAGGLTGLGLTVAGWAVARGVRHLVLAGRRGIQTPEAAEAVEELRRRGAEVRVEAADICDRESVRALVDTEARGMPPLRGVVHSAAVLNDAMIPSTTAEQAAAVTGPKIAGAWNLHECTRRLELDAFLLFSSVSSLLGNAGQASYAAGNAFLDALAAHRRAAGLPCLTVNWGVLGETGMVARAEGLRAQLERIGMKALSNEQVLAALDYLLPLDAVQTGVIDGDWARWAAVHPRAARQPSLSALMADLAAGANAAEDDLQSTLAALPPEERTRILVERIHKVVASTMRLPVERVDPAEPIRNLGLDSLMAVELTAALEARLGLPVPSMELMSGPSVIQLAEKLGARYGSAAAKPAAAVEATA